MKWEKIDIDLTLYLIIFMNNCYVPVQLKHLSTLFVKILHHIQHGKIIPSS